MTPATLDNGGYTDWDEEAGFEPALQRLDLRQLAYRVHRRQIATLHSDCQSLGLFPGIRVSSVEKSDSAVLKCSPVYGGVNAVMDEAELNPVRLAAELTIAWLGNPNNGVSACGAAAFLRTVHAIAKSAHAESARRLSLNAAERPALTADWG